MFLSFSDFISNTMSVFVQKMMQSGDGNLLSTLWYDLQNYEHIFASDLYEPVYLPTEKHVIMWGIPFSNLIKGILLYCKINFFSIKRFIKCIIAYDSLLYGQGQNVFLQQIN